jgi:hypothetical protein
MNNTTGMIPLGVSPDIKVMQKVDEWSHSKSAWKREGQTRLIALVAGTPLAIVGAVFNALVLVIKLPVTSFRVLTGWIPTKNGKFRDDFPKDTSFKHLCWHAYKMVFCTIDIILVPTMGLIHPKANTWIHIKLSVSFIGEVKMCKVEVLMKLIVEGEKREQKALIAKKKAHQAKIDANLRKKGPEFLQQIQQQRNAVHGEETKPQSIKKKAPPVKKEAVRTEEETRVLVQQTRNIFSELKRKKVQLKPVAEDKKNVYAQEHVGDKLPNQPEVVTEETNPLFAAMRQRAHLIPSDQATNGYLFSDDSTDDDW